MYYELVENNYLSETGFNYVVRKHISGKDIFKCYDTNIMNSSINR